MRVCAITGPLCGQHSGRSELGGGGINPRSSGQFAGIAPCAPKEAVVTPAASESDSSGAGWRFSVLSPAGRFSLATFSSKSARVECAFSRSDFFFAAVLDGGTFAAGAFGVYPLLRCGSTLAGGGNVGSFDCAKGSSC